jgi:hypothetical protein
MRDFTECFVYSRFNAATRSQLCQQQAESLRASHKILQPKSPHPFNVPISCAQSEMVFAEVINMHSVLPTVILLVSAPSRSLIWFRTRINGNNLCSQIKYFHNNIIMQLTKVKFAARISVIYMRFEAHIYRYITYWYMCIDRATT